MKKLFALLTMAIMVVSMIPGVLAEEPSLAEEVETMTIDQCVERLAEEFPDARPAQLRDKCAVAKRVIQNTDDEPTQAATIADKALEKRQELIQEQNKEIQKIKAKYQEKIAELNEEQIEKLKKLDRARVNEYLEQTPEEIKNSLKNINVKKVKKEEAFQKRALPTVAAEKAKENYQEAVKNYEQAKKQFTEKKQAWNDAITSGDDEAAITHAKEYLTSAADMVIQSLEKVKANVEGNDDLTEEEATEIITDVDEKVAEMKLLQEQLSIAESKEEIKEVGKEIVASWERMRYKVQMHTEKVVKTQVGEILARSEALEQRLERTLEQMGANATENLDHKITTFSEHIATAREKFAASEELFKEAKENKDRDAFKKSKELAREAHQALKEANNVLTELVRDIKQAGYDIEDQEYVEIIEEVDDEIEIEVEIEEGIAFIEVEFNSTELEFTMETTNVDEIVNKIVSETGLTEEEVRANLTVEYEEVDDEIEIEVEIEEGIAFIEVEFNSTELEFTMETTNVDEIVNKIVSETGLTEEEVRANLTVEYEEVEEEEQESEEETEEESEDETEEETEEEEESEEETTETGNNESEEA